MKFVISKQYYFFETLIAKVFGLVLLFDNIYLFYCFTPWAPNIRKLGRYFFFQFFISSLLAFFNKRVNYNDLLAPHLNQPTRIVESKEKNFALLLTHNKNILPNLNKFIPSAFESDTLKNNKKPFRRTSISCF